MVEGIVTLDGVPVEGAELIFYPVDHETGEGASGRTDEKGYYRISSARGAPDKGTTAGEYAVTISQYISKVLDEPIIDYANDVVITYIAKEYLPLAYTDIKYSPLKVTVVTGKNEINFELDSKILAPRVSQ